MCGRVTIRRPLRDFERSFGPFEEINEHVDPATLFGRYSVALSRSVPALIVDDKGRLLPAMTWGFKPSRAAGSFAPINARAEGVASSQADFDPPVSCRDAAHCPLCPIGFHDPRLR